MITVSTSALRAPLRFAHWQHSVADIFGPVRIETNARALQHAIVRRLSVGAATLVVCESPPLRLTRLCNGGPNDPLDRFLGLEMLCSGRATQALGGREIRLNTGDLVLHHASETYCTESNEPAISAVLLIPTERYARHFERLRAFMNRAMPANTPGAVVLSAALRAAADALRSGLHESQCTPLMNALLELIDMVYLGNAATAAELRPQQSLTRHALAYVEQTLPNPALSVQSIAASLGVSARTVHEIFRRQGNTPARYILQRRLARSAAYLRGPGTDRIAEIAQATGFDDPAYFSRVFRRCYGVSPLRYRRQFAGLKPEAWSH